MVAVVKEQRLEAEVLQSPLSIFDAIPISDSLISHKKPRKRGKSGGAHKRCQRCGSVALPTVILDNVQSFNNKVDELFARVKYLSDYRDSCILCFTETWPTLQCRTLMLTLLILLSFVVTGHPTPVAALEAECAYMLMLSGVIPTLFM